MVIQNGQGQSVPMTKQEALFKVQKLLKSVDLIPYQGSRSVVIQMKVSNLMWRVLDLAEDLLVDNFENF